MSESYRKLPFIDSQDAKRFWSNVDASGGIDACWPWKLTRFTGGYGAYPMMEARKKRNIRANRVAYFLGYGTDPGPLLVCHRCDNPPCCNPAHLFLGTWQENIADCRDKGRMNSASGARHGSKTKPWSRARGERIANVKLTSRQVVKIREAYASGLTQQALADSYGVDRKAISFIIRGVNWAHIPCDADALKAIAKNNQHFSRRKHRRFSVDQIRTIRKLRHEGVKFALLAEQFGVSEGMIAHIADRRAYGDID